MAKSRARAERRARERAPAAPRIETEAERIARLRLARMARDMGLLPRTGIPGLKPSPDAPVRRVDAPPELLNAGAPRLDLAPVPKPARVIPPACPAQLRDAEAAWIARHGKPAPIEARDGVPADVVAMLAMLGRGATLGAGQMARLQQVLAARQGR